MTLINYLSRVHFADGILEDALHSEMECNGYSRPLIICENRIVETEHFERLISGLPYRSKIARFEVATDQFEWTNNDDLNGKCISHEADVIVAFGCAHVIADASRACTENRQTRLRHKATMRTVSRVGDPGFFAIPGIDGLPNFNSHLEFQIHGASQFNGGFAKPDVIICDPTITLGEPPERTASSAVLAMVSCIEALVSDTFNPPADGIAMDGLLRTVQNLHQTLATESLEGRRELMAGALSGMLAQQKSTGIVQALIGTLAIETKHKVDDGAIARLLLPAVLELNASPQSSSRHDQIKSIFSVPPHIHLHDGLRTFLADLPLPLSLSELRLTKENIQNAIRSVNMSWGPDAIGEETLMSLMISKPYQK